MFDQCVLNPGLIPLGWGGLTTGAGLPGRRNILDHAQLRELGFIVYALGKPLDPFIQKQYS